MFLRGLETTHKAAQGQETKKNFSILQKLGEKVREKGPKVHLILSLEAPAVQQTRNKDQLEIDQPLQSLRPSSECLSPKVCPTWTNMHPSTPAAGQEKTEPTQVKITLPRSSGIFHTPCQSMNTC